MIDILSKHKKNEIWKSIDCKDLWQQLQNTEYAKKYPHIHGASQLEFRMIEKQLCVLIYKLLLLFHEVMCISVNFSFF